MVAFGHYIQECAFFDKDSFEVVAFFCSSDKKSSIRPIKACGLLLNIVNVAQFFKIFIAIVIFLHKLGNLCANFLFNLRMAGD